MNEKLVKLQYDENHFVTQNQNSANFFYPNSLLIVLLGYDSSQGLILESCHLSKIESSLRNWLFAFYYFVGSGYWFDKRVLPALAE